MLQNELGRIPSDREVAERIGVSDTEFTLMVRDSNAVSMTSLSRKAYGGDSSSDVSEVEVIRDDTASNPIKEVQKSDLKQLIQKGLTPAERLILILYYYEEMTMKEIGVTLDLSESRVSQMHSSILARLKAQMQHRSRELEPIEE
jgi:RNA polymerase sigma factor for flagellar operon FliA